VIFYGDYVRMCEDFALNFGCNITGCCITITISHLFFTRESLTKNNTTLVLHPPYFPLFPRLKIKLESRHFDRIGVIEAESQAVLNTLTEHDFQNAFKKMAEALGTVYARVRELLQGR
jgi:hypothetical protein